MFRETNEPRCRNGNLTQRCIMSNQCVDGGCYSSRGCGTSSDGGGTGDPPPGGNNPPGNQQTLARVTFAVRDDRTGGVLNPSSECWVHASNTVYSRNNPDVADWSCNNGSGVWLSDLGDRVSMSLEGIEVVGPCTAS